MSDTLYSWGRAITDIEFLDHTWVTDYSLQGSASIGGDYWRCWGALHTDIRAKLSETPANLTTAKAIMPPNVAALDDGQPQGSASSRMGSIVYYGLDGVCHQAANQVLAATATSTAEPARVTDCQGYALSTFFYGTYGLNNDGWNAIKSEHLEGVILPGDDFLTFLKARVDADKQSQVSEIRASAQEKLLDIRESVVSENFDYYGKMLEANGNILLKLLELLGFEGFGRLFDSYDMGKKDYLNLDWMRPPL